MSQSRKKWKAIDLASPKSRAIYTQSPVVFRKAARPKSRSETLRGPCPPLDLVNKCGGKAKGDIILKT